MPEASDRTIYIPYMGDHSYILQAAFEAMQMRAEVLPPPDDESVKIGLDLVLGRECAPCMTTVGDIIRRSAHADFRPKQAAIFMPTAPGPCRFGQYERLQRLLLNENGLEAIEIISPSSENGYRGFGPSARRLRMLVWDGAVAFDLLQRLLHRFRPYEVRPGEADAIYAQGLARIVEAMKAGGSALGEQVSWFGDQFEALAVKDLATRPLIGLVGEIYVRLNAPINQNLIRRVEALDGEVLLAGVLEWIYLTTWNPGYYARRRGEYGRFLIAILTEHYQRYREHALARRVAHLLPHPYETPVKDLKASVAPYLEPTIETEAVLTLARALEMGRMGVSGILSVMPFACMPGVVTAAIAPRLRADLGNIPWLDISYDLQKSTNIMTRLEAFMYQAEHFQRQAPNSVS